MNSRTRTSRIAWLVLLFSAALSLWFVLGRREAAPSSSARHSRDVSEAEPAPAPPLPVSTHTALPLAATVVAPGVQRPLGAAEVATDGLPYMPAAADAPAPTGPVHPHPVTDEHARIFRENRAIQSLNDAMDSKDPVTLRRSLTRYRTEYPEDAQGLQDGYELIANCLEQRPGYRALAQRYFDEERGSSLRRFVLRHCLGGP